MFHCHIIALLTKKGRKMTVLTDLYNEADMLELQLDEINTQIQEESSRLADTVTMDIRKASIVLTDTNTGKQVVVSYETNTYSERKIWEYNGKRGKLIAEGIRYSNRRIKIQLANGELT